MFQFCNLETQQHYILQEEVNISNRGLSFLVDRLCDLLNTFDEASNCSKNPLPKHKEDSGLTESKNKLFVLYYNGIIEHPNKQIRLSFRLRNNNSCVFSMKNFELRGNLFIFTENVKLNLREIHHTYKNRY